MKTYHLLNDKIQCGDEIAQRIDTRFGGRTHLHMSSAEFLTEVQMMIGEAVG